MADKKQDGQSAADDTTKPAVAIESAKAASEPGPARPGRTGGSRRESAAPPVAAAAEPVPSVAAPAETAAVAESTEADATVAAPVATITAATTLPARPADHPPAAPTTTRPATINPSLETVMTTAEEMISFQQGNLEALIKSGQIWAAGLQDLGRTVVASAQAQFDETIGTFKALTSAKSLREAVELHSSLARASMEKAVSESGKLTDASIKLAEQTLAPITARFTLAAERFGRPAV